jgi:hypothetical protein
MQKTRPLKLVILSYFGIDVVYLLTAEELSTSTAATLCGTDHANVSSIRLTANTNLMSNDSALP